MVFFTAWLLPATTARRTQQVRLWQAFLIHLVALVFTFFFIAFLVVWGERPFEPADALINYVEGVIWFWGQIAREPGTAFVIMGFYILFLEGVFLLLAFMVSPWGAGDERLRVSYGHALRHCWLRTICICPAAFVIALVTVALEQAKSLWRDRVFPNSFDWDLYYQIQPWYVRYYEDIMVSCVWLVLAGLFWMLLRAVGAKRIIPAVERPPLCEFCGYNLTAARMEGRCPECGELVMDSLGPQTRTGTAWHRRQEIGFLRAWWRTGWQAILHPVQLGRQIPIHRDLHDHRLYLRFSSFVFFLLALLYLPLTVMIGYGYSDLHWIDSHVVFYYFALGAGGAALLIPCTLLAAALVGWRLRVTSKQNLLHPAVQVASYLSGYVLIWSIISSLTWALLMRGDEIFSICQRIVHIELEIFAIIAWLMFNLLILVVYVRLLVRGTLAAQYANR